ncbi:MAG: PAS-domain containing protein [Alphaproteobacteria bacterium]|nr:PAS-domain containing protein [Alphaproteobacteria bacterium]
MTREGLIVALAAAIVIVVLAVLLWRARAAFRTKAKEAERLRAILDDLPLPVWWRGRGLGLEGFNRAYSRALDSDRETVLREGSELGAGAIDEDGKDLADRALRTNMPQSKSHYVVSGGTRRLLEFTETPQGEDVTGYAVDVTALEEVQSELAQHIAAHADVLESLATAIAIFGPDRRLKFFNTAFLTLWRVEAEPLRGEPMIGELMEYLRERRVLPEYVDFPAFKREQEGLFTSLIETAERLLHTPDGRTLRRLVTPHPMGGLMYIFEDVTDRLSLERSYNTLIEVQQESLNNLYEGVAVFGGDGRLRLWNPILISMWGLDDTFLDGEPHIADILERTSGLFPEAADWPALKQRLIVRVTEPQAHAGRLERIDGSVLDYACVALPDGGCFLSYIDVTDSVRVQRALEERAFALETADRVKTEFISNVSYELRTPLNAIAGFSEILGDTHFGPLNDRQREYLASITNASKQLMALIDDILDLATIDAGYMALDLSAVDVGEVLEAVGDLTRERLEGEHAPIEIDCPDDIGEIVADGARLRQALVNLVYNVTSEAPGGRPVALSARRVKKDILVTVGDPADDEPEAAGLQFLVPGGNDRFIRRSDTGLGLALTRSLIELHGGEVNLKAQPDQPGAHAVCRLPVGGPVGEVAAKDRGAA